MTAAEDLLRQAYAAYSAQDLDGLLVMVSDDVDWPDGAGGRLRGKKDLRSYWVRQWCHTRTHDEPVAFVDRPDGTVEVLVAQVVRSLGGAVLSTGSFRHLFRVEGAQVSRLDVEAAP